MNTKNGISEPVDLTKVLEGYEGKWVVISEDEKSVIKSADNLEELAEYTDKGIIMLVPETDYLFIGKLL